MVTWKTDVTHKHTELEWEMAASSSNTSTDKLGLGRNGK